MERNSASRAARVPAASRGESGQVLVFFVIGMGVLLGVIALATDVGQLWRTRQYLRNTADAASLAGALDLPDDPALAQSDAVSWAGQNGVPPGDVLETTVSSTYVANDTITVKVRRAVAPMFGRLVGWNGSSVGASATALVGSVKGSGMMPWGLQSKGPEPCAVGEESPFGYCFGEPVSLKIGSPGPGFQAGNFGSLAIDGPGGNTYFTSIENGGSKTVVNVGDWVDTLTGNRPNVVSALDTWAANHDDTMGSRCGSYTGQELDTWFSQQGYAHCRYRVVFVPIISDWPNGAKKVQVAGIAQVYVTSWEWDGGATVVNGYFVKGWSNCDPESGCVIGSLDEFGTRAVKLIK